MSLIQNTLSMCRQYNGIDLNIFKPTYDSDVYEKYNIPKINTDIQLQQDTQNVANNTSNVSNDLNLVRNTSNNVQSKNYYTYE